MRFWVNSVPLSEIEAHLPLGLVLGGSGIIGKNFVLAYPVPFLVSWLSPAEVSYSVQSDGTSRSKFYSLARVSMFLKLVGAGCARYMSASVR